MTNLDSMCYLHRPYVNTLLINLILLILLHAHSFHKGTTTAMLKINQVKFHENKRFSML